jgi:hypothetical protein
MKYKVTITRTTYNANTYEVEAENQMQAEELALEEAYNDSWGSGNAEYEIEDVTQ